MYICIFIYRICVSNSLATMNACLSLSLCIISEILVSVGVCVACLHKYKVNTMATRILYCSYVLQMFNFNIFNSEIGQRKWVQHDH